MKQMTKALRLELAQYNELLDFSQFGTELDPISQKRLAHGAIVIELLKQKQSVTYNFVDQALMLFLLKENFLNKIALKSVQTFATQFIGYVQAVYTDTYNSIKIKQEMDSEDSKKLKEIATEFSKLFI